MQYNFLEILNTIRDHLWGPVMITLLLGTGIYLSLLLRFIQVRKLIAAFKLVFSKGDKKNKGEISGFKALTTALAGTVGTGNIAGVATAIVFGGPGAIFWLWLTGIIGMATKFAEAMLAVKYRQKNSEGDFVGGPMYYIVNGLGSKWKLLAGAYAVFAMLAAFGAGNSVQSNSIAEVLGDNFHMPHWITGAILVVSVGVVLFGGIKSIGRVTSFVVPCMAVFYVLGCSLIIYFNRANLLPSLHLVIDSAFNGAAASGGFLGATVMTTIRFGVARGMMSNEAGLGAASIVHAVAKTNNPLRQALIAMTGTFIDSLVICTFTALVILTSGQWMSGKNGAVLTAAAFQTNFSYGGAFVSISLVIFAFTTLLGWSYYGERCANYLFTAKVIPLYRVLWLIMIFVGSIVNLEYVWTMADILNACMAVPNLIAIILLATMIRKITKEFEGKY